VLSNPPIASCGNLCCGLYVTDVPSETGYIGAHPIENGPSSDHAKVRQLAAVVSELPKGPSPRSVVVEVIHESLLAVRTLSPDFSVNERRTAVTRDLIFF
jgi:hypothetical protein